MQRRYFISTLAAMLIAAAPSMAAPAYNGIDVTGAAIGPDYQLFYADGKPASLRDFKGKYVMLFFGFTYLPLKSRSEAGLPSA